MKAIELDKRLTTGADVLHNREIEEAIKFLVFALNKKCRDPKPVLLHSIKVGIRLYNLDYGKDIIIAAVLHDLLEDSEITVKEIRSKFGRRIARLVEANSLNRKIKDKSERYKENFDRCLKAGKEALIIKAADILENSYYYHLAPKKEIKGLLGKMKYFIDYSESMLKNEPIYRELKEQYRRIAKAI